MSAHPFAGSGDLSADRRYLWGEGARTEGDLAAAADLYRQAAEAAPGWAAAWFALGRTLADLARPDEARAALRQALALDPGDTLGAALLLTRLGGVATAAMSPRYVAKLFDDYADRFDDHLTGALAYRGPQVLLDALDRAAGGATRFRHVLDLGCGTGLMGVALAGRAHRIEGADLSARMLEKARRSGRYDALEQADVVTFLDQVTPGADLIIAADVLVYIGDLAPLFAAAARVLAPGGLFAFTVQAAVDGTFALGPDLRFAHSAGYLRGLAALAGFAVLVLDPVSTRRDGGRDVPGLVAVLAKAGRGLGGHS